jgi:hypothetical protein
MSQRFSDRRHVLLLSSYDSMTHNADTEAIAQQHLTRLLSPQHSVATAWLDVMPTKDSWEIDDITVKKSLRFMLGLSPGPPEQTHLSVLVVTGAAIAITPLCVTLC